MRKPGLGKMKTVAFELKSMFRVILKVGCNRSVPTSGRASVGSGHCSVARPRCYIIFLKNRQEDGHI